MSREALVVGINRYPLLKKNIGGTARHLQTAAADAEAIAQLLEEHGNFNVQRFPSSYKNGKSRVEPNPKPWELLKATDLELAIVKLFNPPGKTIPDTALLFFAGHGLRKVQGGVSEGFLASSDVCPSANNWGVSLQWLRQLIKNSPVRQQLVWLDCCYSGELLNFSEADPGHLDNHDRCFVAASREFEEAYEQISENSGILTSMLVRALNPNHQANGWISNYALVDFIKQQLTASPQRPIFHNSGSEIILTGKPEKIDRAVLYSRICPYKGLSAFEFNEEDPKYFYGRTALVDKLIEQVRESNFLAVVGASGSGKSSVVKAGLLHQLRLGQRMSGSDLWRIEIFRPGENPIHSLAKVFVEAELLPTQEFDTLLEGDYYQQRNKAEALLNTGAVGLATLVKEKVQDSKLVLVVDQFEEAFTLCQDKALRQQFFACLLDALPMLQAQLCLVITMRADFFGKCAEREYAGLADLIQEHLVTVTPMTEEELRQAITQPASKVGLEVERELVEQMVDDVEGPASLPLLQFALTELWRARKVERLTVAQYTQLGGVKGTLQKRAETTYQSLSHEKQQVAKRIFLDLIYLGEGTEDTRRRVPVSRLETPKYKDVFESTLKALIDARLLVASLSEDNPLNSSFDSLLIGRADQREDGASDQTTSVEIVHEALIRNWETLRMWLDANRAQIGLARELERKADEWKLAPSNQREDFLLSETELIKYQDLYINSADQLTLEVSQFINVSIKTRDRLRKEEKKRKEKEFETEINYLVKASEALLLSEQDLNALILTLWAGKKIQKSNLDVNSKTKMKVVGTLQNVLCSITEMNRLEGHEDNVKSAIFSPDGQTIATASEDKTVKLWNTKGQLLYTLKGHQGNVTSVVFSPDGQAIATASEDKTAKIWNAKGQLLYTLKGHEGSVNSAVFSPDGQITATASWDKVVKLWNKQGELVNTLNDNNAVATNVVFSLDGQTIALSGKNPFASPMTSDADNTVRLWNLEGNVLYTLQGHTSFVSSVAFSPDGQTVATASSDHTVGLWHLRGEELIYSLQGHTNEVRKVVFSPNGQILASISQDKTVRLWHILSSSSYTLTHINPVNDVAFSPDGQTLASANSEGTVKLWDIKGKLIHTFKGHTDAVNNVAFSPDGQLLISASDDKTVRVWNIRAELLQVLEDSMTIFDGAIFSPDGEALVSAGFDRNHESGLIELRNIRGELIREILTHTRSIDSIAVSSDGNTLASASWDGIIKLWDRQGNLLQTIESQTYKINKLLFNPDGETFISTSSYISEKLFDKRTYSQIEETCYPLGIDEEAHKTVRVWHRDGRLIDILIHQEQVTSVIFNLDGQFFASASWDGVIKLWDRQGNLIHMLKGHTEKVSSLKLSPNGQFFASASFDNTIKLWDWQGNLLCTFESHIDIVNDVAFTPDGQILASASRDKTIKLWNLKGQLLHTLNGHTKNVEKIVFSPNGNTLASAGDDYKIRLWSVEGELIHSFSDFTYKTVKSLEFSTDGQILSALRWTVKLWSLNLDDVMKKGCDWVRDYLTNNPNVSEEERIICNDISIE